MGPAGLLLRRNVRPARVEELSEEEESGGGEVETDEAETSAFEETDASEKEDEVDGQEIGSVSFGALKQAQDGLSRKRKRDSDTTGDREEKLAALRDRMRQIRGEKQKASSSGTDGKIGAAASKIPMQESQEDSEYSSEDSDSGPSEQGFGRRARTSKHAPASQSSKHQVTRRRTVIDVPKRTARDPRFDAMKHEPGSSTSAAKSSKAYQFLVDYQKAEIVELRAALKATKNEEEKQILLRKAVAMENRLKAKEAKEREQEVVQRHRKDEKERVLQGKKPFHLKQKEVKERALVEKFRGMKGKDREKLVERRRKKEGQREKRKMPRERRVVG